MTVAASPCLYEPYRLNRGKSEGLIAEGGRGGGGGGELRGEEIKTGGTLRQEMKNKTATVEGKEKTGNGKRLRNSGKSNKHISVQCLSTESLQPMHLLRKYNTHTLAHTH